MIRSQLPTIYKFPLPDRGDVPTNIAMPRGAEILSIQIQKGRPVMWAVVITARMATLRRIIAKETGAQDFQLDVAWKYLGTLQFNAGNYVLHYFDAGEAAQ